jgi:CheY-like chemotaxis protein
MRLLVVEDEKKVASFILRGLEAERFAVDVATDGLRAIEMASACEYDLIILDLTSQRMEGVSQSKALKGTAAVFASNYRFQPSEATNLAVSIFTRMADNVFTHFRSGGGLMRTIVVLALLCVLTGTAYAQQSDSTSRLNELERKLDEAAHQLETLGEIVRSLRAEIAHIKSDLRSKQSSAKSVEVLASPIGSLDQTDQAHTEFIRRIVEPELGHSEREEKLQAKPEIFIQSRYSALPIKDPEGELAPNFSMERIETRWSGKVSERIGAGLEIQFHPALDGSAEELVNDAFVEYYLNGHTALRVGQFIKPFGFDIQQSSAVRESPERGMFAGYFFPGQRDRGLMIFGDLNFTSLKNIHYFIGAFNGNRFFADSNRQTNYVLRVRKVLSNFAIGLSAQRGKQILPPSVRGNNDENLIGMDVQYAAGRFGLRGELVAGNTPSTLLGIEPEFAAAFRPGAKSSAGSLFATWRLTANDHLYARYDQFNRDPQTGYNVRAFNFGYLRYLGEMTRIGIDYQFKNRPSFNDDAVNGRFHINWSIEF